MSMDGLALYAVCCELQPLIGGKIDKVQQPDRDALLLSVRQGGQNHRLLLSAHAENGRVQLTEQSFVNPPEPPMFCMLLRRRLAGGRIVSIRQRELDRVLTIAVETHNELGDPIEVQLVTELMGKHSNIIFVLPDGTVGDCIKHVGPQMSSVRTLLPGCSFHEAPVQDKINPLTAPAAALQDALEAPNPVKALSDRFFGLSRSTLQALLGEGLSCEQLYERMQRFSAGCFSPTIMENAFGEPVSVFPFAPAAGGGALLCCETMSAAYDRFYEKRDAIVRIARHSAKLRRVLETHLGRAEHKLTAYREALMGEEKQEQYRLFGELITANLYRIQRGQTVLKAENYYADPPEARAVPLDPLLNGSDNAQRYFKQYRKSRAARAYAEQQLEQVTAEIAYLEGQLDNIGKCDTLPELHEIQDELVREGYLKPERKGVRQQGGTSKPMRFVSPDGVLIYVGKNNRQNDALTLRADGEQMWLHVKNIPGSHVIIDQKGEPGAATLYAAAQLAAYYSKARQSASVPVDYTPRKFVKKPSGARAGMVIYSTNKTLYITPDESYIKGLKQEETK